MLFIVYKYIDLPLINTYPEMSRISIFQFFKTKLIFKSDNIFSYKQNYYHG
jgi:hypothetical protein